MKKLAMIVAVFAAVAVNAGEPRIALTRHNFSGAAWNDTGSICQPCHTPHGATAGYPRLWSRAEPTVTYEPFEGGHSTASITYISKMCLSCHDGVTALESFAGNGAATTTTITDADATTNFNIGTSLKDDHPVGFEYHNGGYVTDYTVNGSGTRATVGSALRLRTETAATDTDGDGVVDADSGVFYMECTTCHNPHGAGTGTVAGGDLTVFPALLRVEQADLCTTCHTK